MKIIAFFSEKGGVGKSSYTLLYSSWLKYKHGIKVAVADFNKGLTEYRKDEIVAMKKMGTYDESLIKNAWPIIPVDVQAIRAYGEKNPAYAMWLKEIITNGEFKDMDVVLVDLPGSVSSMEMLQLVKYRIVKMVFIPFDKEMQALSAAISIKNCLERVPQCRYCGFFIKVQTSYGSKQEYVKTMKFLEDSGIPVLPDMISFSERMAKFEKLDMIRTTFSYPDWESKAFSGSKDLGIENLFIDITKELIKTPDYPGTAPVDLSFVNDLKKDETIQSLNRQLNGTSFHEYEVEMPEEMKTKFKKNR